MAAAPKIVLRYFDCQGRAEPLRRMLVDSGVEFVDEKVPISEEWVKMREDPNFAGPLKTLPVLHWDSFVTPGTEAIALYLAHKFGYVADGSLETLTVSAALCSVGHSDIIKPAVKFLYEGGSTPEKSIEEDFKTTFDFIRSRVVPFEQYLSKGPYLLGEKLSAADFFVSTACDIAFQIFGEKIMDGCPKLKSFLQQMAERPRIKEYLNSDRKPTQFCASVRETEILEKTRCLL